MRGLRSPIEVDVDLAEPIPRLDALLWRKAGAQFERGLEPLGRGLFVLRDRVAEAEVREAHVVANARTVLIDPIRFEQHLERGLPVFARDEHAALPEQRA